MAGAINAPDTGNTFETYLANARGFQGTPGVRSSLLHFQVTGILTSCL